jgi:hypothetical protein
MLRTMFAIIVAVFLQAPFVAATAWAAPDCQYQDQADAPSLFPGIGYRTLAVTCGAKGEHQTLAHILTVDIGSGALRLGASTAADGAFGLQLPSQFLVKTGARVAVNANLFSINCCNYSPAASTLTTALCGWEASGGQTHSPVGARPPPCQPDYPFDASLVQLKDGGMRIVRLHPAQTITLPAAVAVTGSHMLVFGGRNVAPTRGDSHEFFGPNARTLAGLSKDEKTLWLVALDKTSSLTGLQLDEAAETMLHLTAASAINLDGGGSTSMVQASSGGGFVLLNSPADLSSDCTVYYPDPAQPVGCERYVGASLGVFAVETAR